MMLRRRPVPEQKLATDQQVEDRIKDELRCTRAEQVLLRRSCENDTDCTTRLDQLLDSLAALHARP